MLIFCVLDVHDVSTLWQSMSTKLHREVALSEKIGQNFVYKINENSLLRKINAYNYRAEGAFPKRLASHL